MTTTVQSPYANPANVPQPSVNQQFEASGVPVPMRMSSAPMNALAAYRSGGGRTIGADPGAAPPLRQPGAGIPGGPRATPAPGTGGVAPGAIASAMGQNPGMPATEAPTGGAVGVPTRTAPGGVLRPPSTGAPGAGSVADFNARVFGGNLGGGTNAGAVRPGAIRPPTLMNPVRTTT